MSTYSVGFDIFAKDRASDVFDKVGNKVDGSSDRMSKFKERAVVAGAVAGAAIVAFGKSSVEAFVDADRPGYLCVRLHFDDHLDIHQCPDHVLTAGVDAQTLRALDGGHRL